MSSRTQIRLAQLTGSLISGDTSAIDDQLAASATGSIDAGNLSVNLSHMASAIKRLHGSASFSEAEAGVFYHSETVFSGSIKVKDSSGNENFIVDQSGNTTIKGDLLVIGDTSSTNTYITSSVFEFQDPLLVGNALYSEGTELKSSASFGHTTDVVENQGDNDFDYGLVFKRSLRVNPPDFKLESNVEYSSSELDNHQKQSFGVFKFDTSVPDSGIDAGQKKSLTFDANSSDVRNGVAYGDLLNMAKGHYALLSGSGGKGIAIIVSASNTSVELQALGTSEGYGTFAGSSNDSTYDPQTLSLLSAYAGSIFDREDNKLHIAAAALTGSADNQFLSSSANVLAYGSVASSGFEVYANDILSGSNSIGKLVADYDNSGNKRLIVEAPVGPDGQSAQILLSASNGVFFEAGGENIKLPTADGANNQVLVTNGSGVLSFANTPISTTSGKSVAKVRQTLTSGSTHVVTAAFDIVELSDKFSTIPGGRTTGSLNVKMGDIFGQPDEAERIDVFVNGQLLISGADGAAVHDAADYRFVAAPSNGKLEMEFAFDLEADDILTIITK